MSPACVRAGPKRPLGSACLAACASGEGGGSEEETELKVIILGHKCPLPVAIAQTSSPPLCRPVPSYPSLPFAVTREDKWLSAHYAWDARGPSRVMSARLHEVGPTVSLLTENKVKAERRE